MKNIDFEFKPKTYFKKKNEKRVVVATISFSEGTKIYLNVKGNENEFEFYLTDTINELEYKYSFENMKSDEMLNLQKIIDIIQNDIADCEGKKNIIFEEWTFQYHQFEPISLKVESEFYPQIKRYYEDLIDNFQTNKENELREDKKYDQIIYDHIQKSNIKELSLQMQKVKFGAIGVGSLRRDLYSYVKDYLNKNDKFPIGKHKISGQTIHFK